MTGEKRSENRSGFRPMVRREFLELLRELVKPVVAAGTGMHGLLEAIKEELGPETTAADAATGQ